MSTNKSLENERRITFLLDNAKTKEGERVDGSKTGKDISASSIYYMLDKDSYQLKIWLYPTNKSKTYQIPIKKNDVPKWLSAIESINTFYDDCYTEKQDNGWNQ